MPKVTFLEDYDYNPAALKGALTTAYKAGKTETVNKECADAAIAAGKAKRARGGNERSR